MIDLPAQSFDVTEMRRICRLLCKHVSRTAQLLFLQVWVVYNYASQSTRIKALLIIFQWTNIICLKHTSIPLEQCWRNKLDKVSMESTRV